MKKLFIVPIPLYPCELMVAINHTDAVIISAIKKWKKLSNARKHELITFIQSDADRQNSFADTIRVSHSGYILIRVFAPIEKPAHHAYLAHEIFHAVEQIAEHIGMKHSEKSSEAFAYLIDYITEKIYDRLK
jgi:hypothetical protein